jgi:hypothetical protein|nr:MAG TPA: hypothetical protein [Caudoviricetes sp.]
MSKPKYGWWGYVKWMVRQYPNRKDKNLHGKVLDECSAVQKAIDQTMMQEDGANRMQIIELVFFKQTHTIEGAAMMAHCGYETAKRWVQQFIKTVARNRGLMD